MLLLSSVVTIVLLGSGIGSFALQNLNTSDAQPGLTTQTPGDLTDEPTATRTGTTVGAAGPDTNEQMRVSLGTSGENTILNTSDVAPGDTSVERLTLINDGERAGRIRLAQTDIVDLENGIVGPEVSVDNSSDEGELSEAIEVRLSFEYADGTNVTVLGSQTSYVPLAAVNDTAVPDQSLAPGEELTVWLEWRVDPEAGNEIQSDITVFDVGFELRVPETTSA